jgi:putative transposase
LADSPPPDDEFDTKVEDITGLYISAIERHQNGERTISIDEMTGVQATERLEKDLPMRPGKVERREFEYIRHGTQTLIANFDVATGKIVEPTCGDSRTELDFLLNIHLLATSLPISMVSLLPGIFAKVRCSPDVRVPLGVGYNF